MNASIKFLIGLLCLLSFASMSMPGFADPGKGQGQGQGKAHGKGAKAKSAKAKFKGKKQKNKLKHFSKDEQTSIANFFEKNPATFSSLPPGIAMNVARGKPLPPGIAKRYLPPELLATLPVYHDYEYLLVGKDVVLVNTHTGIIDDIILNVLR